MHSLSRVMLCSTGVFYGGLAVIAIGSHVVTTYLVIECCPVGAPDSLRRGNNNNDQSGGRERVVSSLTVLFRRSCR